MIFSAFILGSSHLLAASLSVAILDTQIKAVLLLPESKRPETYLVRQVLDQLPAAAIDRLGMVKKAVKDLSQAHPSENFVSVHFVYDKLYPQLFQIIFRDTKNATSLTQTLDVNKSDKLDEFIRVVYGKMMDYGPCPSFS